MADSTLWSEGYAAELIGGYDRVIGKPGGTAAGAGTVPVADGAGSWAWGTAAGGLSTLHAELAADLPLSVDEAYHDVGVSIVLAAGTWLIFGAADMLAGAADSVIVQLLAGATVIGGAGRTTAGRSVGALAALRVSPGETVKLQAKTSDHTGGDIIKALADAAGSSSTRLVALRVA